MNNRVWQKHLTSGNRVRQPGLVRLLCLGCVAVVSTMLLASCSNLENRGTFPRNWVTIKPGMQREQVVALLGKPTHGSVEAEEIYLETVKDSHWELHIQYDAGGTVAAKRYYCFE